MSDLEFAEDDVRAPGRPVPMPHRDLGPPTGIGRRIVLPSTGIPWPDPFRFKGSVGLGGDNFRDDVIRAQVLLGNSGDYDLASLGAPTGWPGGELWRGIRKYQKRKGLTVDGILQPVGADGVGEDGVGETVSALRDDLGTAFDGRRVPTPEEVDRHYNGPVRSDGGKENAAAQLEIALRDESGTSPHYPLGTVSDADYPSQPEWRDGAQVAQAIPVQSLLASPPVATTGSTPQNPYPHEHPEVKAAGRQLQRLFDNAGVNATRWYEAGQAAWAEGKSRDPRPSDAEQAAFTHMPGDVPLPPSRPISDADQAATKTPPLVPPRVDDKLEGRPAEEQQAYVEKLIPPEMKEWYEGLEPFDQQLIRDLSIQEINPHGSLGKPSTQLTDLKIAKLIAEERAEMFPELEGIAEHQHGSYRNGNRDDSRERQKQKHIPGPGPGNTGSSRTDLTVVYRDDPKIQGHINSVSGQWKDIGNGVQVFVSDDKEVRSFDNLLQNLKGGIAATIPKLDTTPDEQVWEAYARQQVRFVLEGMRRQAYEQGLLQSSKPLDLPPPGILK
jgi:hypothetical protein